MRVGKHCGPKSSLSGLHTIEEESRDTDEPERGQPHVLTQQARHGNSGETEPTDVSSVRRSRARDKDEGGGDGGDGGAGCPCVAAVTTRTNGRGAQHPRDVETDAPRHGVTEKTETQGRGKDTQTSARSGRPPPRSKSQAGPRWEVLERRAGVVPEPPGRMTAHRTGSQEVEAHLPGTQVTFTCTSKTRNKTKQKTQKSEKQGPQTKRCVFYARAHIFSVTLEIQPK